MTSTMVAHPGRPREGLVLHLDLHPQMMMMKSRFQWQVRYHLVFVMDISEVES